MTIRNCCGLIAMMLGLAGCTNWVVPFAGMNDTAKPAASSVKPSSPPETIIRGSWLPYAPYDTFYHDIIVISAEKDQYAMVTDGHDDPRDDAGHFCGLRRDGRHATLIKTEPLAGQAYDSDRRKWFFSCTY